MNNEEHACIKIYDYTFILDYAICVEQKSNQREFPHKKGSSGVGKASEQQTLAQILELI